MLELGTKTTRVRSCEMKLRNCDITGDLHRSVTAALQLVFDGVLPPKMKKSRERKASKVSHRTDRSFSSCNARPGKASVIREDEIKHGQSHVYLSLDHSLFIMRQNQMTAADSSVS